MKKEKKEVTEQKKYKKYSPVLDAVIEADSKDDWDIKIQEILSSTK